MDLINNFPDSENGLGLESPIAYPIQIGYGFNSPAINDQPQHLGLEFTLNNPSQYGLGYPISYPSGDYKNTVQVEDRIITTPEGHEKTTILEKTFPDKNLQGVQIPAIGLTSINKELVHPWFYVLVHEIDHRVFENHYTSNIPEIDELTNRRVADAHYNEMTIRHRLNLPLMDTAGDYYNQLRNYLKTELPSSEVNNVMSYAWKISDRDFEKIMRMPIDVESNFRQELDTPSRDLLTGEYIAPRQPKKETTKHKTRYIV